MRRCSNLSKSLRTPAGFPMWEQYHKTALMSLYYSIFQSRLQGGAPSRHVATPNPA
jgi:hypothetical protein